MKKESEKKTKVTSLCMTEEQYQAIQKIADKKEMSMGGYIVVIFQAKYKNGKKRIKAVKYGQ